MKTTSYTPAPQTPAARLALLAMVARHAGPAMLTLDRQKCRCGRPECATDALPERCRMFRLA